jgi:hypothetical protein
MVIGTLWYIEYRNARKISGPVILDRGKGLAGESGQNERCLVDLLAVVLAQLVLLLRCPAAKRLLEVALAVLGADHEADLTGWVGRDSCVGVLDVGENSLARLLEVGNDVEVQPLVLGWVTVSRRPKNRLVYNSLSNSDKLEGQERGLQPWVVMTPPSRRAPFRSSK